MVMNEANLKTMLVSCSWSGAFIFESEAAGTLTNFFLVLVVIV